MLDILLLVLGISGIIIASITDIKTREVPDLLNYGMIISASIIRLLDAIINNSWPTLFYTAVSFIALFFIANLMYYSKQWGGGDAKLLMALSIIFATYPKNLLNYLNPNLDPFPFIMTLFINILIIGSLYGLAYSVFLAIKNKDKLSKSYKKISAESNLKNLKFISFLLAIIVFLTLILLKINFSFISTIAILFLLLYPYILIFIKAVEASSMYKMIDINKITEGDWVANDLFINSKKIYSQSSPGITKQQIQELRSNGIKSVLVKEGIPFVPSFLLATIFSLIIGNPLPI